MKTRSCGIRVDFCFRKAQTRWQQVEVCMVHIGGLLRGPYLANLRSIQRYYCGERLPALGDRLSVV